jgi:hypothetical protein
VKVIIKRILYLVQRTPVLALRCLLFHYYLHVGNGDGGLPMLLDINVETCEAVLQYAIHEGLDLCTITPTRIGDWVILHLDLVSNLDWCVVILKLGWFHLRPPFSALSETQNMDPTYSWRLIIQSLTVNGTRSANRLTML